MPQKININQKIKYEKKLFKAFDDYDNKDDIIYEIVNNIDFPVKGVTVTYEIASNIYDITKRKYENKYNNSYKFNSQKYADSKYK